jgi:hypothetical protein
VNGDAPLLSIDRDGDEIVVEWDSTGMFQLQATESIVDQWSDLAATPQTDGNHRTVKLPLEGTQQFFRLRGD